MIQINHLNQMTTHRLDTKIFSSFFSAFYPKMEIQRPLSRMLQLNYIDQMTTQSVLDLPRYSSVD